MSPSEIVSAGTVTYASPDSIVGAIASLDVVSTRNGVAVGATTSKPSNNPAIRSTVVRWRIYTLVRGISYPFFRHPT
jgi:hypothetical protein